MKGFTKEIKIALVAIVGIVVLFFGLSFLKGVTLFSNDNTYYIRFSNIKGLSASSPIMTDGFRVGTVKSIHFDYNKRGEIIAEVGIDPDLTIPEGSTAEITSDLLGNVSINLIRGDEGNEILPPNSTIEGNLNNGIMGKTKELVPQIEKMMLKIDSILTSVNYIMNDPALPSTLHNAERVTHDLTMTTQQVNTLLADANKQIPGLMGKADGVLNQASEAMGNATVMTEKLSKIDLETTLGELTATLNNLKSFTASLSNADGSLGKLINDKEMYNNLTSTLAHIDTLVVNLKEHPKRYVHFSVFGKKDK